MHGCSQLIAFIYQHVDIQCVSPAVTKNEDGAVARRMDWYLFRVKWSSKAFYLAWLANITYGFSINMYLSGGRTLHYYMYLI